MIKSLSINRFPDGFPYTAAEMHDALLKFPFKPCEATQELSVGWLPFVEHGDLAHRVKEYIVMVLGIEKKSVPGLVLKREVERLLKEYVNQHGRTPGKTDRTAIKDAAKDNLLPRAFPTLSTVLVWIDTKTGTLNFDNVSTAKIDLAMKALIAAFPSNFPAVAPVLTATQPGSAMSEWLLNAAPANFTLDNSCELMLPVDGKPTIKYVRHNLEGEDIPKFLADGKVPISLGMTWNDRLSFTLTEAFTFKSIKPTEVLTNERMGEHAESNAEVAEADFLMVADDLSSMTVHLIKEMGGIA